MSNNAKVAAEDRDPSYYESAIRYNEELAKFAADLAPTIEHEEPRRWCLSVAKQHRFHANRHKKALDKLRAKLKSADRAPSADGPTSIADEQAAYAAPQEAGV